MIHPPTARLFYAVEEHRGLFRADNYLPKITSRQPPTQMDPHTGELHQEPATRVGLTMNGALLRRLGHPEGMGNLFPWSRAFWMLRVECRRNHPHHRSGDRPYWRGSLCHQAVRLVVINGWSVENAGKILRVDKMEPLLLRAFRIIEDEMDKQRDRAEKRERELQGRGPGAVPLPVYDERHDMGGLHSAECPKCRRNAA